MNQQQAVIKTFAKDTTRGNTAKSYRRGNLLVTLIFFKKKIDEDPREALLKYAELAENDPLWVSNGKNTILFLSIKSILIATSFHSI